MKSTSFRDLYIKRKIIDQTIRQTRWLHSVLSTFLSPVASSLQRLRMEFLYNNSYGMPELAVVTQTFCIALDFLQLSFWNRIVLLQDWSRDYRILWSSPWTRRSLRCIHLHYENWFVQRVIVFLSSFVFLWFNFLWAINSADVARKAEDTYLPLHLVHAPSV